MTTATIEVKACNTCGEMKPLNDFYKNQTTRIGRSAGCKACVNERQRVYMRQRRKQRLWKNTRIAKKVVFAHDAAPNKRGEGWNRRLETGDITITHQETFHLELGTVTVYRINDTHRYYDYGHFHLIEMVPERIDNKAKTTKEAKEALHVFMKERKGVLAG